MFLTAQRYKFESKSQLPGGYREGETWCFSLHKDTNLKANHNCSIGRVRTCGDVSHCTKIQIWKQITTHLHFRQPYPTMFLTAQRYKFESKSQLRWSSACSCSGCFSLHKDTNLKANHNRRSSGLSRCADVSHCTKIQIWKQITTPSLANCLMSAMFLTAQRYKFESKSQLMRYKDFTGEDVSHCTKIQIWKQITTLVILISMR